MSYIPRLKKEYKQTVTNRIMESHGLVNIMQVPKLKKIVISKGVGAAVAVSYTHLTLPTISSV